MSKRTTEGLKLSTCCMAPEHDRKGFCSVCLSPADFKDFTEAEILFGPDEDEITNEINVNKWMD